MNRLSYCFAAAAGVTVAVVLVLIIFQSRHDSSGVSGSVAKPAATSAPNEARFAQQQTVFKRADDRDRLPVAHESERVVLQSVLHPGEPAPWPKKASDIPPLTIEQLVRRLGGERVAAVMQNPDSVTAVLLETLRQPREPHQCVLRSSETDVPTDVAERISAAVLDPQRNLQIPAAKGCRPIYGVRIRYTAGDEQVDLYLCFQCAVLAVCRNGSPVGGSHIDLIQQTLKDEVVAIFPTDRVLLGLETPHEDLPPTPPPPYPTP